MNFLFFPTTSNTDFFQGKLKTGLKCGKFLREVILQTLQDLSRIPCWLSHDLRKFYVDLVILLTSKSVPILSLDEMNDMVNTIFYINFLNFFVSSKMTYITWIQKTLFLRLNCSLCVISNL